MSEENLARLPLCLHVIYWRPIFTQAENQASQLYLRRFAGTAEQADLLDKPISKPFRR